jgi:hypothetical protein
MILCVSLVPLGPLPHTPYGGSRRPERERLSFAVKAHEGRGQTRGVFRFQPSPLMGEGGAKRRVGVKLHAQAIVPFPDVFRRSGPVTLLGDDGR